MPWGSPSFVSEPIKGLRRGLVALLAVVLIGALGYMLTARCTFGDALYMVVITLSTVGYEEAVEGPLVHYWTVIIIVFGIGTVAYIGGSLVAMIAEGQLREVMGRRRVTRQIEKLEGHYIVCGYGRMGSLVCQSLAEHRAPFVLIEEQADAAAEAGDQGFLYVLGDATDETVLRSANVEKAKGLVTALPSDADNVFITLTARQMNQEMTIVAKAEQPSTHKKLERAGANRVVSPHAIGAQRITNLLLRPALVDLIQIMVGGPAVQALEIDQLVVTADSTLAGLSVLEADIRKRAGLIVVGIKRGEGPMAFNPDPSQKIRVGDSLIVLGRAEQVDRFRSQYGL